MQKKKKKTTRRTEMKTRRLESGQAAGRKSWGPREDKEKEKGKRKRRTWEYGKRSETKRAGEKEDGRNWKFPFFLLF